METYNLQHIDKTITNCTKPRIGTIYEVETKNIIYAVIAMLMCFSQKNRQQEHLSGMYILFLHYTILLRVYTALILLTKLFTITIFHNVYLVYLTNFGNYMESFVICHHQFQCYILVTINHTVFRLYRAKTINHKTAFIKKNSILVTLPVRKVNHFQSRWQLLTFNIHSKTI